ncbi:MAG: outer membrane protein assembly factor BamA, partial [Elusimicrobia bacterium]|nr:outer membrane protein assembly factor BamA [Elusimicrobiota bacterium]
GNKNVRFSTVKGEIKARKGNLYDQPDLDGDVETLLGLGDFDRVAADVSSLATPVPAHFAKVSGSSTTIKLTFIVTERPIVKSIVWSGNKRLSRGLLGDTISLKKRDPVDPVKLREDEDKLLKKYHEDGFLEASVHSSVDTDTTTLKSVVTFTIDEGVKSRITWVGLHGVRSFYTNKLLRELKNRRGKVFVEKDLPADQEKLKDYYLNRGYLDVSVSSPTVFSSLDRQRLYIDYTIAEGRQYRFGDTDFSGNTVYVSTELAKALSYRRGQVFSQERYADSVRAIQEMYAEKGRLRARVLGQKTYNQATGLMDVHFDVTEGSIVYIDHVDVEGNKATKTYVLAREVVVKPGEMFKASRVRKSVEKIRNLGFIDDVDVDIESPSDPDKVDLTFDVTEGKPGMLTAGAAYSSLDGLIGTLSMQHMNLFGRAQRASVQWSFGQRVQDYSLSWTTPWVDNHPTSLGADVFNTRRINPYQNVLSGYVEKQTGATIRLGPRFEEDEYHLNFAYTFSRIMVSDVDSSLAGQLTEGTSYFSSISAEFARDTRDNIWDPTTGRLDSLSVTLSGGPLQGTINYIKPALTDASNYHLFDVDDYPFVLTLSNRAAYITQFGQTKDVPVFARFFLGGQDTLRGYSPTGEVGVPFGGKVFDVFNAELGFPLARERRRTIVKFVTFFDAGTAWDRVKDVRFRVGPDTQDIKTDVGFGIRFTTPAFPIRLDWGYGLNHRPGEKLYQINFGLGNLF